jgi:quercetin dioxygenase-like cupin family protein
MMNDLSVRRPEELPHFALAPGIEARPVMGERMNLNVVRLEAGAVAAVHSHGEEQIGYVARGSCVLTDGTATHRLDEGDIYHAPPGVPHGAHALDEGCVIIDVFAPPKAEIVTLLADGRG